MGNEPSTGLSPAIGNLLTRALGGPADEISSFVSDQFRHWRARNLERIGQHWMKRSESEPIHPDVQRVIPIRVGFPAIEAASKEDDPDIQNMWANLLFEATNPSSDFEIQEIHVGILSQIDSVDALFLHIRWQMESILAEEQQDWSTLSDRLLACLENRWVKASMMDKDRAVQNLMRLRLVFHSSPVGGHLRVFGPSPRDPKLARDLGGVAVYEEGFYEIIDRLEQRISIASGQINAFGSPDAYSYGHIRGIILGGVHLDFAELNFEFSDVGRELMRSCSPIVDIK